MKILTNTKTVFLITSVLSLLLLFAIYFPSLNAPFIYDDTAMVKNNGFITGEVSTNFFSQYFHDSNKLLKGYRPLTLISFYVNHSLFGHSPESYRAVNLIIHYFNVLLLFVLINLLFSGFFVGIDKKAANICALFGSLLFCIHPLNTYSLNLVWKRSTLLAGLFFLSGLIFFILRLKSRHSKNNKVYLLLIILVFILGLLCKEEMITLPLILLLLGYSTENEKGGFIKHFRQNIALYVPLFLIGLVYFIFRIYLINNLGNQSSYGIKTPGIIQYMQYQIVAVIRYINLFFMPTNLNIDHYISGTDNLLEKIISLSIVIALLSLAIFKLFIAKGAKLIGFTLLFFFICLLPSSSIFPLVVYMDESRTYIPMLGLILLICFFIYSLSKSKTVGSEINKYPAGISILLTVMIAIFALMAHDRNKIWKDPIEIWSDSVKKSSGKNPRALVGLANIQARRGFYKIAVNNFQKAVRLEPGYYPAYSDLGLTYKNRGKYGKAHACFIGAEKLLPNYPLTLMNFVYLFEDEKYFKPYMAIKYLNKYRELWGNNSQITFRASAIYYRAGDYKNALEEIKSLNSSYFKVEPSLNLKSRKIGFNINYLRSKIEFKMQLFDQALNSLEIALSMMPENIKATVDIAGLYLMKGEKKTAIDFYNKALKGDSKNFEATFNLGLIFERDGEKEKAIDYYKKAYMINSRDKDLMQAMARLKIHRNK